LGLHEEQAVKILDIGIGKRKVRYLGIHDPIAAPNDPEHINRDERGLECWIAVEALTLRPATDVKPPVSIPTPLQKRVQAELKQAEESKRADGALPDRVRKAEVGVITTIVGPGTSWPCASSGVALKELMKWQKAMLDEQAPDSVIGNLADTLTRTRSIMVAPRERVKILEKEPGIRKVSVIDDKGRYGSGYQAVTAQGCWVAAEAVTR